jgi:5-(carboxyamino)imidazole ribonucleotide synthase
MAFSGNTNYSVGILGGGQLGKMLCQAASPWDLRLAILDKDPSYPAGSICDRFVSGDFNNFNDVYAFGKTVDVLSIEIEHVNIEALFRLEAEGLPIHPRPAALQIIQDKGLQKQFYEKHELPSSPFRLFDSPDMLRQALDAGALSLPFVQKARTGGYDGRGVAVIRNADDLNNLLPGPCVVEDLVHIEQELAVVVARNKRGETSTYPSVSMEFNPQANLVECLLCPAPVSDDTDREARALALRCMEAYDICGLLAVELFLTTDGELLINEVAPRPHNSGHHSIDSCYTSQFEQHLRAICNLPLGSTRMLTPSVMVNLLGAPGYSGLARYVGMEEVLAIEGVNVHLYGKAETRPFRKMGHATILAPDLETARKRAQTVLSTLKIMV